MNDYISRQAAINALAKEYPMNWNDTDAEIAEQNAWRDAKRIIEDLPSAQPEIIRCKDCKYANVDCYCTKQIKRNKEGFCSWAERKQNE